MSVEYYMYLKKHNIAIHIGTNINPDDAIDSIRELQSIVSNYDVDIVSEVLYKRLYEFTLPDVSVISDALKLMEIVLSYSPGIMYCIYFDMADIEVISENELDDDVDMIDIY